MTVSPQRRSSQQKRQHLVLPQSLSSRRRSTSRQRPWTRAGVVAVAGHLAYELLAGVSVPMASRVGIKAAVTGYTVGTVALYRAAAEVPPSRGQRRFAVLNGLFASAVISHFSSWPRRTRAGLPWLTECEGLTGPLLGPYNLLLHGSAVAALGGAVENRRAWPWFVVTVAVVVPPLRRETGREFRRLLVQAAESPRWWNRRLAARLREPVGAGSGVVTPPASHPR